MYISGSPGMLQIELARLEMKDKSFERAVEVLDGALDMAKNKFGDETAEASSVLAALATCHRQAGNLDTSVSLFEKLYDINQRQSEGSAANQSGMAVSCAHDTALYPKFRVLHLL